MLSRVSFRRNRNFRSLVQTTAVRIMRRQLVPTASKRRLTMKTTATLTALCCWLSASSRSLDADIARPEPKPTQPNPSKHLLSHGTRNCAGFKNLERADFKFRKRRSKNCARRQTQGNHAIVWATHVRQLNQHHHRGTVSVPVDLVRRSLAGPLIRKNQKP